MTKDLESCPGDRSENFRVRRSEKRKWRSDVEGVEVYGDGGRVGPDGNPREGQPARGGVQVAASRWLSLGSCSDAASYGVAIVEDPWSPMSHLQNHLIFN